MNKTSISKLTRRIEELPLGARQLEPAKILQRCPSLIVLIFIFNLFGNYQLLKEIAFEASPLPPFSESVWVPPYFQEILLVNLSRRNQKSEETKAMQWFLSLVFVFMLQNCEQWSPPQDSWQDKSGEIILERRLSLINHQLIFASTVTVHENFFWSVLSSAKSSFCGRRKGNSWFPRMRSKRNYSYENHNCDHNLHQPDWSAARIQF